MGLFLLLIIVLIVGSFGLVKLYKKSKLFRNLMFLRVIRRNGYDSFMTISALNDVVRDMLKADGVEVTDLDIVHEIGGRYKAMLTSKGKTYDMTITADRTGNIQYRIS